MAIQTMLRLILNQDFLQVFKVQMCLGCGGIVKVGGVSRSPYEFDDTDHNFYVLIDDPVTPWETEELRAEVLEKACYWAKDETTKSGCWQLKLQETFTVILVIRTETLIILPMMLYIAVVLILEAST